MALAVQINPETSNKRINLALDTEQMVILYNGFTRTSLSATETCVSKFVEENVFHFSSSSIFSHSLPSTSNMSNTKHFQSIDY